MTPKELADTLIAQAVNWCLRRGVTKDTVLTSLHEVINYLEAK